jgi:hypothetical protein
LRNPLPEYFRYALRFWKRAAMRSKTRQICFYLIAACILFAGLAAAAVVYLSAADDRADAIGYEFVDGQAYVITAQDSKAYRHDLERFGGKAAIFADDLNRWFASLWTGKRLACLLAALSIGIALVCFRAARSLSQGENRRLPPAPPDADHR